MKLAPKLVLVAALAACGSEEPPTPDPTPPPGAVIRVGPGGYLAEPGWIHADEIDRWVPTVALVEPIESRPSWRRKALTNIVMPMRVLGLLLPEERAACRARVEAARARLVAGEPPTDEDPAVERTSGNFLEVGLDRFGVAHETPVGEWSELFETIGGYSTVRLVAGPALAEWDVNTEVEIEHLTGYFVRPEDDPVALIEDARRDLGLVPVDPEWAWILPKYYQYPERSRDERPSDGP